MKIYVVIDTESPVKSCIEGVFADKSIAEIHAKKCSEMISGGREMLIVEEDFDMEYVISIASANAWVKYQNYGDFETLHELRNLK